MFGNASYSRARSVSRFLSTGVGGSGAQVQSKKHSRTDKIA